MCAACSHIRDRNCEGQALLLPGADACPEAGAPAGLGGQSCCPGLGSSPVPPALALRPHLHRGRHTGAVCPAVPRSAWRSSLHQFTHLLQHSLASPLQNSITHVSICFRFSHTGSLPNSTIKRDEDCHRRIRLSCEKKTRRVVSHLQKNTRKGNSGLYGDVKKEWLLCPPPLTHFQPQGYPMAQDGCWRPGHPVYPPGQQQKKGRHVPIFLRKHSGNLC